MTVRFRPLGLPPDHPVLLAGTHFVVDGYGNIFAPLLPLLIPHLHLSLAGAGTLQMCYQLANSVSFCRWLPQFPCWPQPRSFPAGRSWPSSPLEDSSSNRPCRSLMMGFAWGTGGLFIPLAGMLADRIGIERTLTTVSVMPRVAAVLTFPLPSAPTPHVVARASAATSPETAGTDVAE